MKAIHIYQLIGVVIIVFGLRSCLFSDPSPSTSPSLRETELRQQAWVAEGKDMVRSKLRDPSSAEFGEAYFNRGPDDIPIACGRVNSKNALGGYTGMQRFISAGKPELTWLEEQVVSGDFPNLWARFCQ